MFLRRQYGNGCWRAPAPRALFVIDDPFLHPTYGFVNYRSLVESMEKHHFATSIAFIPWNYKRTRPPVAKLFQSHPACLSLCVHGCDHTKGEFATSDERKIRYLLASCLRQLEHHQRSFSVPFDEVMVFPQGAFSQAAMRVLSQSRFVAAINTTAQPVDVQGDVLRLEDVVEPGRDPVFEFPTFPPALSRATGGRGL